MKNPLSPPLPTLRRLGYDSYRAYTRSSHWRTVRRLYRLTELPQDCPCGKPGSQLHHQHYRLLGREWVDLTCLKPLCGHCHRFVHDQARRPVDFVLRPNGKLRRSRQTPA
jgi:hypothetical protein